MAEFMAITTQEQLDIAIGERLKRERETIAKKYADYEELKQKNDFYRNEVETLTKQTEQANEKYADLERRIAVKDELIKGFETSSIKTKIALEMGIPYELASKLSGDNEDAIRSDAQVIAQFCKVQNTAPPLQSTENTQLTPTNAALKAFTEQLTNKGD